MCGGEGGGIESREGIFQTGGSEVRSWVVSQKVSQYPCPPPEHQDDEGGQKIPPNPSPVTPPESQTPKTDSDDGHYKHCMKRELRKQQKQQAQQQQQINKKNTTPPTTNAGTRKLPCRKVASNPVPSKPPLAEQPGVQPIEQIEQTKTFAAFQKDFDSDRFDKLEPHDSRKREV